MQSGRWSGKHVSVIGERERDEVVSNDGMRERERKRDGVVKNGAKD